MTDVTQAETIMITIMTAITIVLLFGFAVLLCIDAYKKEYNRKNWKLKQTDPTIIKAINEYENIKGLSYGKKNK